VDDDRWERFMARQERYARNRELLDRASVCASGGERAVASQVLRRPEVRLEQLLSLEELRAFETDPVTSSIDISSVETAIKYAGYLRRQESEVERARKDERRRIPPDFVFDRVPGLSREVVQRLTQIRPDTLGHALRIPGVTPAAVAVLSAYVGRQSM
jgi:tRNA uridine 5-carboxymethylaminomethyl modification enzyme